MITEKSVQRILVGAMFLLGENGEQWSKKVSDKKHKTADKAIQLASCLIHPFEGAEAEKITNQYMSNLVKDLGYSIPSLVMYNDDPKTVFSNIKEVFEIGINRLKGR